MTRSLCVLILTTGSAFTASGSDSVEAVKKAEAALQQALVDADAKTMARLLADDFVRTPPSAPSTSKAEWISQVESGRLQYRSFEVQDAKYRVYGDTVLVNSQAKIRVKTAGPDVDLVLRLLSVWVKQNDEWREAAVQGNLMPSR